MKHTPGKWKHHRTEDCYMIRGYITDPDGTGEWVTVGEVNGWVDAPEEAEANAHLIAAAPELLEALEVARKHIVEAIELAGPCDHAVNHCVCRIAKDLELIDAAIAKATEGDATEAKNKED